MLFSAPSAATTEPRPHLQAQLNIDKSKIEDNQPLQAKEGKQPTYKRSYLMNKRFKNLAKKVKI